MLPARAWVGSSGVINQEGGLPYWGVEHHLGSAGLAIKQRHKGRLCLVSMRMGLGPCLGGLRLLL